MDRYPTNLPIIEQSRVEVLSGPERRRRWTFEQKARVVAESLAPGEVASEVARRHGIQRKRREMVPPKGCALHPKPVKRSCQTFHAPNLTGKSQPTHWIDWLNLVAEERYRHYSATTIIAC